MLRILPEAQRREAISKAFFAEGTYRTQGLDPRLVPLGGACPTECQQGDPLFAEWGAGGERADADSWKPRKMPWPRVPVSSCEPNSPPGYSLGGLVRTGHAIVLERRKVVSKEVLGYLAALN